MNNKIHYVYITTNIITQQQYIGDHTYTNTKRIYLGSGTLLLNDIKQYGRKNFSNEILEWFETRCESAQAQEKYIRLFSTHVSQGGYNVSWTGGLGHGGHHSDETISLMINLAKGRNKGLKQSEELKQKKSSILKGTKQSKETIEKRILTRKTNVKSSSLKGRKRNPIDVEKTAKANTGKKRTDESKEKNRLAHLGKKASDETRQKMSALRKGKPMSEEQKQKLRKPHKR